MQSSTSPLSPLQALQALQSRSLVTIEDGEPCEPFLLRPMPVSDVMLLEESIGRPLPQGVRELMRAAAGVCIDGEELLWNGAIMGQEVAEAFPCSLALMEDGLGNSWNVDIDRVTGEWGAVYYVCHDPAVVVLQATSLAEFIIQFADDGCQPEREGSLYLVAERAANKVWDSSARYFDAAALGASSDPVLRTAATGMTEGVVCDLRTAKMGDGFAWGRYGPRTIITRPGREPVWTLHPPAGSRKWWKLWG